MSMKYNNVKFFQIRYHNLTFTMLISCFCMFDIMFTASKLTIYTIFGTLFFHLKLFVDIVGWSTSSLRRRTELPKVRIEQFKIKSILKSNWAGSPNHLTYFWLQNQKFPRNNQYPHVINEEPARTDYFYKAEHDDDMTDDMEGLILSFYELITIVLALKNLKVTYIILLIIGTHES